MAWIAGLLAGLMVLALARGSSTRRHVLLFVMVAGAMVMMARQRNGI